MRNRGLLTLLVMLVAPTVVGAQSAARTVLTVSVRVVRGPAPLTSMADAVQPAPMVTETSRAVVTPVVDESSAAASPDGAAPAVDETGGGGFDAAPAPPPPPVSRFRVLTINY